VSGPASNGHFVGARGAKQKFNPQEQLMASDIPMPRDLTPERPAPPERSPYAPKATYEKTALEALERTLTPANHGGSIDYGPLETIKTQLKRLTHRQMHEVVREIFAAKEKAGRGEGNKSVDAAATITKGELADVLDRFAYGD
jgi:hypothetical protein